MELRGTSNGIIIGPARCMGVCVCVINKKKVLTNTRIQLQNKMRVKNKKFVCLPHLLGDGIGGFIRPNNGGQ